jgi:restriction system protein
MPVPAFHRFLHPLLSVISDGREYRVADIYDSVAERMGLTAEDRGELLPSGKQRRYANRVGWAKTYLAKAGLVATPRRGFVTITPRGIEALASGSRIDLEYLGRFAEFQEFREGADHLESGPGLASPTSTAEEAVKTPEERLEDLVRGMNRELARELLEQVRGKEAGFFEHVVVRLLVKMGYGGSFEDAGRAIGRSGDGGIDGIIKQDRLGLDTVYVQAKRYAADNSVGAGEVRNLAGALQMRKATKGVLITTSSFTKEAISTAQQIGTIVLVDGEQLAQLMIEFDLGVSAEAVYPVKKVDQDFFDDWS